MQPVVLTNAFLRPRATRLSSGLSLSEDTSVFASVEEMITVIRDDIKATALMLPTSYDNEAVISLLEHVDGIMLPGAASNIHPSHYGQEPDKRPQIYDQAHDTTDMFLIDQARRLGIPFFGICRAMQAMNIVFGGSLNQYLDKKVPIDHFCSGPCDGHDDQAIYMHDIRLSANGLFSTYFDEDNLKVNSLHEQAIDRLGKGLSVEATAADGVIEAISWPDAPGFFASVQWHPEALPNHPVSQALFHAFRADVEAHSIKRRRNAASRNRA